jgi:hypothetical protein
MPFLPSLAAASSPFFHIARAEDDGDAGLAEFAGGLKAEAAIAAGDERNFGGSGAHGMFFWFGY